MRSIDKTKFEAMAWHAVPPSASKLANTDTDVRRELPFPRRKRFCSRRRHPHVLTGTPSATLGPAADLYLVRSARKELEVPGRGRGEPRRMVGVAAGSYCGCRQQAVLCTIDEAEATGAVAASQTTRGLEAVGATPGSAG